MLVLRGGEGRRFLLRALVRILCEYSHSDNSVWTLGFISSANSRFRKIFLPLTPRGVIDNRRRRDGIPLSSAISTNFRSTTATLIPLNALYSLVRDYQRNGYFFFLSRRSFIPQEILLYVTRVDTDRNTNQTRRHSRPSCVNLFF